MDLNEFHKQAQANAQRQQDIQRHMIEVSQERQFQQQLQSQTFKFQKEQTDRFLKEYKEINTRLTEINQSLQSQLDEQKRELDKANIETKTTKRNAWIQFAITSLISIGAVVVSIISLVTSLSGT